MLWNIKGKVDVLETKFCIFFSKRSLSSQLIEMRN